MVWEYNVVIHLCHVHCHVGFFSSRGPLIPASATFRELGCDTLHGFGCFLDSRNVKSSCRIGLYKHTRDSHERQPLGRGLIATF